MNETLRDSKAERYDAMFDVAYLFSTTEESPFAKSLGRLLFAVINEAERSQDSHYKFPEVIVDRAWEMAVEWTAIVEAKNLDDELKETENE